MDMIGFDIAQCHTDVEWQILEHIAAAETAVNILIPPTPASQEHVLLRAEFVFSLLNMFRSRKVPPTRVEFAYCRIEGALDLSANPFGIALCFRQCIFDGVLRVADCRFPALELRDCCGTVLDAERIEIAGQFTVEGGCFSSILLSGARIHGQVAVRNCKLEGCAQDMKALEADGLRCAGTLDLSGLHAFGGVRLNGANIGRDLKCNGIVARNTSGWSLSAAGATIKGSAYLGQCQPKGDSVCPSSSPSVFHGGVHLEGATINGNLDAWEAECTASNFVPLSTSETRSSKFEGYFEAIRAGGTKIGGSLMLKKLRATGTVWLADAVVGLEGRAY
jgi:hypothetical protein